MRNDERRLYQNNNTGYMLVMVYIALNTIYTFFILNSMEKDLRIGTFVMLTIILLLMGFLMAIKVRIYSLTWSIITIVIGFFQFTRLFFTVSNLNSFLAVVMNIVLVLSAIFCLSGGFISVINTNKRNRLK